MSLEINIDGHTAKLQLIERDGNYVKAKVDDMVYELDLVMVERGVYSILHNGKSYNIELVEAEHSKMYNVNTYKKSYVVEIIDAEVKYMRNRKRSLLEGSENTIISPMPGKVVKIMVSVGDKVEKGHTLIIVAAMKMENEYKSSLDGKVKQILVKEGDIIDSNQPLILIE